MKHRRVWPWTKTKPVEVEQLEERAEAAKNFVDEAEHVVRERHREIEDSADYFRRRRKRNHLTELFVELYGKGTH